MPVRVSTIDVRQRIGDILNRVALRRDEFIIERKGQALAALVPVDRLQQMRRFARQHVIEVLQRQRQGPGNRLSDEAAMAVALEAQQAVRRRLGAKRRKAKRARK